ncbi:hypothetical protein SAMN06265222_10883 [Neorhodopirellula lusitana]|uniref:Squalene cyclase C-terminal domain-containing protein n=1 Tax=Neorhodopirellula lusitana TaxID=445327 RepID=A0ABY1QA07_9BACT|nr:prenyltransferase/squalene oxidase repeat-containing protein [Neorhodopirellula lusitana]SMP63466.1 hypothetical protein SAMN06265222_10883 [Neorhodopirellula lusitana]
MQASPHPAHVVPPPIDSTSLGNDQVRVSHFAELMGLMRTLGSRLRVQIGRTKDRILHSPSWLVSLVLHVAGLLILAFISIAPAQISRIVLQMQLVQDVANVELVEFSIEPLDLGDLSQEDTVFDSAMDLPPADLLASVAPTSITPLIESFNDPSATSSQDTAADGSLPAPESGQLEKMFAGRTGAMKEKLLKAAGGTKETEAAVALGLQWLQRNQQRDGSWSLRGPYQGGARGENQVSATAMAMLAFMGAGSTHRGGQYQKTLWKAARWLVKQQDRQGFMAQAAANHEKMYSQAQAMIALCELYAMTGDSWIRPYAQLSCDFACEAQSPEGGWRYQPRFDSDTSVTGWFLVGLKSGEAAGLKVDHYVFPPVDSYLDSVSSGGADRYEAVGYAYKIGERASPSMTAEGLLCRQYLGHQRNMPGMGTGLTALVQNHPLNMRQRNVYYWYYATQALHHYGGPLWTQWNDELKVRLPAAQETRGRERGSWSPVGDQWGFHAGRLYTTCFSLYCLEVYYRHMPIYEHDLLDET